MDNINDSGSGISQGDFPPDAPKVGDRFLNLLTQEILVFTEKGEWIRSENVNVSFSPEAPEREISVSGNISVSDPSAISIFNKETKEVLRIEADGRIFWRKPGQDEMLPVEMDQDLALAFSLAVETMAGLTGSKLMNKIREDAVNNYITESYKQQKSQN